MIAILTKAWAWLKRLPGGLKWFGCAILAGLAGLFVWRRKVDRPRGAYPIDDDPTPRDLPVMTPAQGAQAKQQIRDQSEIARRELEERIRREKERAAKAINPGPGERS
jgi:hypothetical protein